MHERRKLLEVTPGGVRQRLTAEECAHLCREWELAFPANREGIHVEQFMWHVFGFNRMAFTHEDKDFGPYFAVHQDYDRLQRENVNGMRKCEKRKWQDGKAGHSRTY